MQAWEEKELERQEAYAEGEAYGRREGEARGRREGEARGRQEGENRINKLYSGLLGKNRIEDMQRAITDAVYREKLLKEFKL